MSACAVTIKTTNLLERTKIWVALDVQNVSVVKASGISTTPEAFRRSGYG
ncbi:hypothetical protein [Microtetraspora malaysiensis]